MIDVLIVEDEMPSARKLKSMLEKLAPDFNIVSMLESIAETVDFLKSNSVELIFMDIHLADGNSFEIFKHIDINTPIIFTTAFDQYAIKAFDQNSIGYLLKPLSMEKLQQAIHKYREQAKSSAPKIDYQQLSSLIAQNQASPSYRNRYLIHFRNKIKAIDVDDIAYFYAENRGVYIRTFQGQLFDINSTLESLSEELDPNIFFRANRKYLVNIKAINEAHIYSKSKLKLELSPASEDDVIVSSERASKFKHWLAK